jgi:hypothetical protein
MRGLGCEFYINFKMIKNYLCFSLGIFLSCLLGCRHSANVPDQPAISFSKEIQPIVASNCAQSGCHDGIRKSALLTYQQIVRRVKPGDAHHSSLYTTVIDLSMPPKTPLSDDQAKSIYIWIMQGANNN